MFDSEQPQPPLTIGALSRATGCKVETIRYYERAGLMPQPVRSAGGYRLYNRHQRQRLGFIRRARELGFSLDQIRALLAVSDDKGSHTRAEVKSLIMGHIEQVRRKITDLNKLKRSLETLASRCDGAHASAQDCPILRSLSAD